MNKFAEWLSTTAPSVFIQNHNAWAVPTIQTVHIVGIAMVIGAAFMIYLRILGSAWTDQTMGQTMSRFLPWLTGSLWLLLASGLLLVVAEPVRELVTISFWVKMFLVAVITLIATMFQRTLQKHEPQWGETLVNRSSVRWVTMLTFLIWMGIILLGRLIAYDHVWGSWSPATKA